MPHIAPVRHPEAGTFHHDHSFNDPSCEAGKEGESLMLL
jgi:hypothetical protein